MGSPRDSRLLVWLTALRSWSRIYYLYKWYIWEFKVIIVCHFHQQRAMRRCHSCWKRDWSWLSPLCLPTVSRTRHYSNWSIGWTHLPGICYQEFNWLSRLHGVLYPPRIDQSLIARAVSRSSSSFRYCRGADRNSSTFWRKHLWALLED